MNIIIRAALAILVTCALSSCLVEKNHLDNDWAWHKGANRNYVPLEVSKRGYR